MYIVLRSPMTEINEKEIEKTWLKRIRAFIGVNEENFSDSLAIIDREYGGMESYLQQQLFLTPEDIALLRERYLE